MEYLRKFLNVRVPGALGMNERNSIIRAQNTRESTACADSKGATKELLEECGIDAPIRYAYQQGVTQRSVLEGLPDRFVIKPDRGSQGEGILVLERLEKNSYRTPVGALWSGDEILAHVRHIVDGRYSQGDSDAVLIEECIEVAESLRFAMACGMPDIRVIVCNDRAVLAMLRYPNERSGGKANLSQGAFGLGVALESGAITRVYDPNTKTIYAPAMLGIADEYRIPHWETVLRYAESASRAAGLGYAGVDLTLATGDRPVVLELNARPGLMIQNVTGESLRPHVRHAFGAAGVKGVEVDRVLEPTFVPDAVSV